MKVVASILIKVYEDGSSSKAIHMSEVTDQHREILGDELKTELELLEDFPRMEKVARQANLPLLPLKRREAMLPAIPIKTHKTYNEYCDFCRNPPGAETE